MILNQYCLFHLRILCYLHLKAFSIHDFKSVLFCSISGYCVVYIFQAFSIHDFKSVFFSTSGYYVIYIFQEFPIHDVKCGLCVPFQDTMLFIFFVRFQFMILNQGVLFHLRILWNLYFRPF